MIINTNNNQTNVGRTKNGNPISDEKWELTINHIKSQIELKETDDIIEFCCGNGMVLGELSKICKMRSEIPLLSCVREIAKLEKCNQIIHDLEELLK